MMPRQPLRAQVLIAACMLASGALSGTALAAAEGDTTTVYVTGTLVDAPECTVNANNNVNVSFGSDVITYQVNGENYKQKIPYTLTCTNISSSQGLKMTLNGSVAGFNNTLFKTSNTGLGIRILNDTSVVSPGGAVNFDYWNQPVLWAVPVEQNPDTLNTGYFEGSATMVISYQ